MKVFITGGTSGIGLELARHYLKRGDWVAVTGRDLSKLDGEPLQREERLSTYEGDVRDADFMRESIEHFQGQVGGPGLDLVLANAGRSVGNKSHIPNFSLGREVIETNVTGTLNTFEPAMEIMCAQGHGHLAAVSSVAGFIGLPTAAFYSASKAAVTRLCEAFSIALESEGIAVTCLCPGFIDTPLTRQNNHKMPFLMDVTDAAQRMAWAIEQKKGLYVFPWQMKWIIGFFDKMPRRAYRTLVGPKLLRHQKN